MFDFKTPRVEKRSRRNPSRVTRMTSSTLVSDLGGKLRRSLGVAAPSEGIEIATRAALPSNEKAARLYAEGRARLWAFDYFRGSRFT